MNANRAHRTLPVTIVTSTCDHVVMDSELSGASFTLKRIEINIFFIISPSTHVIGLKHPQVHVCLHNPYIKVCVCSSEMNLVFSDYS